MDKSQFRALSDNLDEIEAALDKEDTGYRLDIGNNRRITISDFTGKFMVDMREYYQPNDGGDLKPGRKGIMIGGDVLKVLAEHKKEALDALD